MKPVILLLLSITLFSCSTAPKRPPVWQDEYGITHIEEPSINAITWVKVVLYYKDIPAGCKRLRNIYLYGRGGMDWTLKTEAAKMQATHVIKEYWQGVQNTMGIAYDCRNAHRIRNLATHKKMLMRNRAMSEIERRTFLKGNNKVKENNLPVFKYNDVRD